MKKPQPITDTEMAVLKLLWDRGPLPVKSITEALYPKCTTSDVGTVHSMIQRLEAKKLVKRDRNTHPQIVSATVNRTQVAGRQLEKMADKLADGSMVPFLTHLMQSNRLNQDELEELRTLLDQHSSKKKKKR